MSDFDRAFKRMATMDPFHATKPPDPFRANSTGGLVGMGVPDRPTPPPDPSPNFDLGGGEASQLLAQQGEEIQALFQRVTQLVARLDGVLGPVPPATAGKSGANISSASRLGMVLDLHNQGIQRATLELSELIERVRL